MASFLHHATLPYLVDRKVVSTISLHFKVPHRVKLMTGEFCWGLAPNLISASSAHTQYAYLSYFGRAEYSLDEKYFADFSVRNDQSSRFGKANRSAMFYSGGLMWNAKKESFLKDIAKTKTMLAVVAGSQSSIKLTYDCVLALEARVALCMQNWTTAIASANALIASGTYPLINNATALKAMWLNDVSTEVILQLFVSNPNELANTNSIYLGFVSAKSWYVPDFVPQ